MTYWDLNVQYALFLEAVKNNLFKTERRKAAHLKNTQLKRIPQKEKSKGCFLKAGLESK